MIWGKQSKKIMCNFKSSFTQAFAKSRGRGSSGKTGLQDQGVLGSNPIRTSGTFRADILYKQATCIMMI